VNVGSDLINQVRNGFRQTKDILDRVRAFLPQTADIQEQLTAVDQLEQRAASESWPDLFAGIMTMHALIDAAAGASAASLLRTSEAADTAENEAMPKRPNRLSRTIYDRKRDAENAVHDLSTHPDLP